MGFREVARLNEQRLSNSGLNLIRTDRPPSQVNPSVRLTVRVRSIRAIDKDG